MTSDVLVGAAASGTKSTRGRLSLAANTALAAGLLASPLFFSSAQADGTECGAPSSGVVTCTGTYFPGSPAGNTNGGIEYTPGGTSTPFTLNLNTGASVTVVNNSGSQPNDGITINHSGSNLSSTQNPVTVNTQFGTSITAPGTGIQVYTDGANNPIVINAGGNITTGSSGIFAETGAFGGQSGAGAITITNTGHIQTTGTAPGIVAFVNPTFWVPAARTMSSSTTTAMARSRAMATVSISATQPPLSEPWSDRAATAPSTTTRRSTSPAMACSST